MIKLDIINEVVNKTGITKTKAEMAVETVFESMKKALSEGAAYDEQVRDRVGERHEVHRLHRDQYRDCTEILLCIASDCQPRR